ncbi:hypothetical protein Tco_0118538 [Tanacetum coccineum]
MPLSISTIHLCYWGKGSRTIPWLIRPVFAETFGTIPAWAIPPSSQPPQNDSNGLPDQWTRRTMRSSLGSWSSISKFSRIGGGVPSRSSWPSGAPPLAGLVILGR